MFGGLPFAGKLISPFSLRFKQDHVSSNLKDGTPLESAIGQIRCRRVTSTDEYDVVLDTPFHDIKVARWFQAEHGRADAHWFSLNSRRLYCLQKAAASLWPQRVAVSVEVLYLALCDPRCKCESTSVGRSIFITEDSSTVLWDWRRHVDDVLADPNFVSIAYATVVLDESKSTFAELSDSSPTAVSAESRLYHIATGSSPTSGRQPSLPKSTDGHDSSSDCLSPEGNHSFFAAAGIPLDMHIARLESASSSPGSPSLGAQHASEHVSDVEKTGGKFERELLTEAEYLFAGVWFGKDGDAYETDIDIASQWTCTRTGDNGVMTFTIFYDKGAGVVWWGTGKRMYVDLSEARALRGECLKWRMRNDSGAGRPRWVWHRNEHVGGHVAKEGAASSKASHWIGGVNSRSGKNQWKATREADHWSGRIVHGGWEHGAW